MIDLLAATGPGRMLIVDYKSDRVGPSEDIHLLVERDYSVQRLIYALAVLRTGAEEVEVAHWFLQRPGELALAVYRAPAMQSLEAELAVRLRDARSGSFAVSPRPHRGLCLTCPGRGGLCSWGDRETLREYPQPDRQAEGLFAIGPARPDITPSLRH